MFRSATKVLLFFVFSVWASAGGSEQNELTRLRLSMSPDGTPVLSWADTGDTSSWTVEGTSSLVRWDTLVDLLLVNSAGSFEDKAHASNRFYRMLRNSEPPLETLERNRSRWEKTGLTDYRFTFRWLCFCTPDYVAPVEITVLAGEIAKVSRDGVELGPEQFERYHTINGLFDFLQDALHRDPYSAHIRFDGERGYPLHSFIDYSPLIADEEIGFTVRDLRSVEDPPAVQIVDRPPGELRLDPFVLEGVRLEGDHLVLSVGYSGGCREHTFELFMSPPAFAKSFPVQASLYVRHDSHGDLCEAFIREDVVFDVRPIAELYLTQTGQLDPIILNVFEHDPPGQHVSVEYVPKKPLH